MDPKSLCILGRLPAIGRAELESLFGADHVEPLGDRAMLCDIAPQDMQFARLGSVVRLAKPLVELPTAQWAELVRYATQQLPSYIDNLPQDGKLKLGLSVFGLEITNQQLLRAGLELKKVCKRSGRSVRVVPNEAPELSSAQVLHNRLTGEMGIELLFVVTHNKTYLAQTLAVQDITAYARRDQNRPKRDARVGMLPPKLAQTIVNLGAGTLPANEQTIVLDPFCGTGVVLQEALLMGYGAYGTDLEPRMIDYTTQNLDWLATSHGQETSPILEVGDATNHQWQHPFTMVASELYLGRALSSWPNPEVLREIIGTCNVVTNKFLKNLATQTPTGTRICLALPAWRSPNGRLHHLETLDRLGEIGYNRISFKHVRVEDLLYFRPNQLVARELLIITRK